MDDAQSLFREGVLAIRSEKDMAKGQRLLMQSLKLNPQNEMGWLWLARTLPDPKRQMDCIQRALAINPANEQAQALRDQIAAGGSIALTPGAGAAPPSPGAPPRAAGANTTERMPAAVSDAPASPRGKTGALGAAAAAGGAFAGAAGAFEEDEPARKPKAPPTGPPRPNARQQKQIDALLAKADELAANNEVEAAIEQWVRVLEIQVDHDVAIRSAVRHLSKLNYMDDAKELIHRAIAEGTLVPGIYLTAIDIAKREGDGAGADELRMRVVALPGVDDKIVLGVVDDFVRALNVGQAVAILEQATEANPKSQKLLLRLGDLYHEVERDTEAARCYDAVAKLGLGTPEGKEAAKHLKTAPVLITDADRGAGWLAWREAAAFPLFTLLLAFQDAGLSFAALGAARLGGVGLSLVGGYLLVSATSSPQQEFLTRMFGGDVPLMSKPKMDDKGGVAVIEEQTQLKMLPGGVRGIMGLIGGALVVVALALSLNTAFNAVRERKDPQDMPGRCDILAPLARDFDDPADRAWFLDLLNCP